MQPTCWIEAILASRSSKKAFLIYRTRTFQPAADARALDGVVMCYDESQSFHLMIRK
jgi:hypothetical protein